MKKWPVERKVFSGFAVALFVLVVVGSLAFYNGVMLIANHRLVAHTQQVLAELGLIYSTVQDAETSQRGYLLTGEESYLTPYRAAVKNASSQLALLGELTKDNPRQNARVTDLKGRIALRLSTLEETLTLREREGYEAAVRMVTSGRGTRQMASVHALVLEMQTEESRRLQARAAASEANSRTTIRAAIVSVILVAILLALAYRVIKRDMAERKRAEEALRASEQKYRLLMEGATDGVVIIDRQGNYVEANDAACRALGYTREEFLTLNMQHVMAPEDLDARSLVEDRRAARKGMLIERNMLRKDGTRLPVEISVRLLDEGSVQAIVRDVTERKRAQEALHVLATQDALTGLLNRREMDRVLEEEVARCRRYGRPLSLVMVDIDRFKCVNDRYGHKVGDEVLRWISDLFRNAVRSTDRLARYGGEEIVAILPETAGPEACRVAERFRSMVAAQPFTYMAPDGETVSIPVTISLGVAELPRDALTPDSLVIAADGALYQAKRFGRDRVVSSSYSGLVAAGELVAR